MRKALKKYDKAMKAGGSNLQARPARRRDSSASDSDGCEVDGGVPKAASESAFAARFAQPASHGDGDGDGDDDTRAPPRPVSPNRRATATAARI